MKLSIIIPVFNLEKYLPTCLDSLLDQDLNLSSYEIIIINDGSTDKSGEVGREYSRKYFNIVVHDQENSGLGAARNKGISIAKGDYIYIMDPDDYLGKDVLKPLIELCSINDLDILCFESKSTTVFKPFKPTINLSGSINLEIMSGIEFIGKHFYMNMVWWYFVKRKVLIQNKLDFIENRWMEDAIFTTKLFIQSNHLAKIDFDVHRHLIRPNSAMTSKEPTHYLKVIDDNANAALVFKEIIDDFKADHPNKTDTLKRLKTRQESFVFFMMIRMLKSKIKKKAIRETLIKLADIGAYPMHNFISEDYNSRIYRVLVPLLNNKSFFLLIFSVLNPILKRLN